MKNALIVLFFLVQVISAKAETEITFFKGTFPEALAEAKKQNKLLFIDCFTTWCGPCKWMAAHVFTDATIAKSFNENFVCYTLDMEKGEGLEFAKKYSIKNYPTFLWLDKSGKQIHRSVGSAPAEDFLAIANHANNPKENLSYLEEQYTTGNRNPELVLSYARALKSSYDTHYQIVADEYFKAQPDKELANATNWKAILEFTPNINSHTYGVITNSISVFYEKYGKDSVHAVLDELALNSLEYAKQQKDTKLLTDALTKLKESKNPDVVKEGLSGELAYYKGNKDYVKYASLAHDYVNNHFMDDPQMLNAVCWTYFQHVDDKASLTEAEKWIAQSVKLDDKYYNTDTYANLLNKMGKKKEAIEMTKHSIECAKKENEDYASTQELLNDLTKE